MRSRLRSLVPDLTPPRPGERLRAAAGALLGVLATGLATRLCLGPDATVPALIAPMGASAVLLFAVPASPLAQPWSIVGGNLVAGVVGVTAAAGVADPVVACALAAAVAIALMGALRCLHPPSGAIALTAVLGGPAIRDLGYAFVLWPVGLNSLLLLATALAFNNLTGHSYPHRAAPAGPRTADPPSVARVGVTAADLDAVLREYGETLDVGRDDLAEIVQRAQARAYGRRFAATTCADIMSRDVVAVSPHASLREALDLLRTRHVKALPVTDEGARVLGLVTQTDILDKAAWGGPLPRIGLARRLRLTLERGRAPHGCVEDIMTAPVPTLAPDGAISDAVPAMARAGIHHLPVVGRDGRLAGIVSQTDLVAALLADAAARDAPAGDVRRPEPVDA